MKRNSGRNPASVTPDPLPSPRCRRPPFLIGFRNFRSVLCFEPSAFIRHWRGEVKAEEGRAQPGKRGKGCRAGNSSRRVGVFNGEWSHLRFLMMIRGGNWLRFTVSLITETEEGENRIKASKLSRARVRARARARLRRCETERERPGAPG